MTMGGKNELVTDAKLLKLDIYPDTVMCVDGDVAPGSVPLLSQTFRPGEAITLDIPPGHRTLVLTTYADQGGTILTGSGCTTTTLAPGGQMCINLTITATPDMAMITDLSVSDMAVADLSVGEAGCVGSACPCSPAGSPDGDSCPAGQFCDPQSLRCAVGCKSNGDCVGMGPAGDGGLPRTSCNTTLHQCVECLASADCPLGKLCSPSGVCVLGCDSGHACPGGLSCCNSMCVDTTSDPLNCGTCGNSCDVGNATTCCSSQCTDLNTSVDNCGMCGRACSTSNVAVRHCTVGQCTPDCNSGRGDCNLPNTNDGCEADLTQPAHCGSCNTVCDTTSGHSSAAFCNADGGICSYTCTGSFADCDSTPPDTNGCETDTSSDPAHCGGCAITFACDTTHSLGAFCSGGNCTYTGCKTGFDDCIMTAPDRDGCETPITTVSSCGGCNNACSSSNESARACALDGGVTRCVYTCSPPFADCNKTPPDTSGCTINTSNDPANCTNCGIACDTTNSNTPACNGTKCTYASCKSGHANCNAGGLDTNGCECSTSTTPPDGGCCGTGCQTQHSNCMNSSVTCTNLGQSYFDCTSTGTFTLAQAMKACVAKTGSAASCHTFTCPSPDDGIVCDATSGTCNCWDYSLTGTIVNAGLVYVHQMGDTNCFCPTGAWPTWN
jgi:hypothetical protein